jgi:hypothetical protein
MELKLEFITGQDKDGEDVVEIKTFVTNKIKARLARRALEIKQEVNFTKGITPEDLDVLVDFACEVYKNKFTRDEFYDGLESGLLYPTLIDILERISNGVADRLDTFPQE